MREHKPSQMERVYQYMIQFGSISGAEAFTDLGIMHLPRRIADLIEKGVDVKKRTETIKNRFGESTHYTRYYLEADEDDIIEEEYWEEVDHNGGHELDFNKFKKEWLERRAQIAV